MPPLMTTANADRYDVAARVARGMARVDLTRPPGWDAEIDLSILDISSSMRCICGQLAQRHLDRTGDHQGACAIYHDLMVDTRGYAPSAHGFASNAFDGGDYPALAAEWRRVITLRRQLAASVAA